MNTPKSLADTQNDDVFDTLELLLPEATKHLTMSEAVDLLSKASVPVLPGEWSLEQTFEAFGASEDVILVQTERPHETSLFRRLTAVSLYRSKFQGKWLRGDLSLFNPATRTRVMPIEGSTPYWPAIERGIMPVSEFIRIAREDLHITVRLVCLENSEPKIEDRRTGGRDYRLQQHANEMASKLKKEGGRPTKSQIAQELASSKEFRSIPEFQSLQVDRIERLLRVKW